MKYVRKAKCVEAIQYDGNNIEEILNFIGKENIIEFEYYFESKKLRIQIKFENSSYAIILNISDFVVATKENYRQCDAWDGKYFLRNYDLVEEKE